MLRIDLALSTPVTNRLQTVCALNLSRAGSVLAPSYQLSGPWRSIWGFTPTQLRKPIVSLRMRAGLSSGVIVVQSSVSAADSARGRTLWSGSHAHCESLLQGH
jgi:hypothetical protein